LFVLNEVAIAQQATIHNATNYDLHVALAAIKDNSVAGIGDSGYNDPNRFIISKGWFPLRAGQQWTNTFKDNQFQYEYVLVSAFNNGRRFDLPLSVAHQGGVRPHESSSAPFAVRNESFTARVRRVTRGDQYQAAEIRQVLYEPVNYHRLLFDKLIIVGATQQDRAALDNFVRQPPPPGESHLFLVNQSSQRRAFELTVITKAGQSRTFSDWKSAEPGATISWQLETQFGEIAVKNTSEGPMLLVGVKLMRPDQTEPRSAGFDVKWTPIFGPVDMLTEGGVCCR